MQLGLFSGDEGRPEGAGAVYAPLAERMKPRSADEFVGQEHIMDAGPSLKKMIRLDALSSLILYGPPGTGKTSLARVIAQNTKAEFLTLNAAASGMKEIKESVLKGERNLSMYGRKTVLFIDEIHRFNKLQQDALLPYVENGKVILIGATTENPYFEVNSALISRSVVCRLEKLSVESILKILKNALSSERGLLTYDVVVEDDALRGIAIMADGDARRALGVLEAAVNLKYRMGEKTLIAEEDLYSVRKKNGADNRYDVLSAFIKSMRGSDPNAAVYYLALMLESGEDPMTIARRIVICAAEDVGNADPTALILANAACEATRQVGMPEARIPLAQAATYIACAPKSNAAYLAIEKATADIRQGGDVTVPPYLRDGTAVAMELRHSLESASDEPHYRYPHDYEGGYVRQRYLPEGVKERIYYEPKAFGEEKRLKQYLQTLESWR